MIVEINKINNDVVHFSSKYGSAFGKWRSSEIPYIKKYGVEFDFDGIITNDNISFCDRKYEINSNNNKIELSGKIVEIDKETLLLYIGDTILLFTISVECSKKYKQNDYVCITVPSIDLYNENLIIE